MKDDKIHIQLRSSCENPDAESVSCLVVLISAVLLAALLLFVMIVEVFR